MNIPRTNSFQSRLRYLLFFSFIRTQCTPSAIHYCSLSRSLRHSVAIYFPLTATTASNAPSSLAAGWVKCRKNRASGLIFSKSFFPRAKKKWNGTTKKIASTCAPPIWDDALLPSQSSLACRPAGRACYDAMRWCSVVMFTAKRWHQLEIPSPNARHTLFRVFLIFIFVHRC